MDNSDRFPTAQDEIDIESMMAPDLLAQSRERFDQETDRKHYKAILRHEKALEGSSIKQFWDLNAEIYNLEDNLERQDIEEDIVHKNIRAFFTWEAFVRFADNTSDRGDQICLTDKQRQAIEAYGDIASFAFYEYIYDRGISYISLHKFNGTPGLSSMTSLVSAEGSCAKMMIDSTDKSRMEAEYHGQRVAYQCVKSLLTPPEAPLKVRKL